MTSEITKSKPFRTTHTHTKKNGAKNCKTRYLPQQLQTLLEILQLLGPQLIHFDPARQVSQQAAEQVSWAIRAEGVPGS